MQLEFPYQIVTFLDNEPDLHEPVYNGSKGWYPQVAVKRRFKLADISEDVLIKELQKFFQARQNTKVITGGIVKPERMPVKVVSITNQDELKQLHIDLLNHFSEKIISRYPDREDENYYPHITAEYDGKFVIPVSQYEHKEFLIRNIWLLKDVDNEDSLAYAKIQ